MIFIIYIYCIYYKKVTCLTKSYDQFYNFIISFNFLDIKPNNSVNVTAPCFTNFMHKAFLHSIVVYEDEKKPKLSGASDVMDTPWNMCHLYSYFQ